MPSTFRSQIWSCCQTLTHAGLRLPNINNGVHTGKLHMNPFFCSPQPPVQSTSKSSLSSDSFASMSTIIPPQRPRPLSCNVRDALFVKSNLNRSENRGTDHRGKEKRKHHVVDSAAAAAATVGPAAVRAIRVYPTPDFLGSGRVFMACMDVCGEGWITFSALQAAVGAQTHGLYTCTALFAVST